MLEIIHDMAPGAGLLYQATGGGVVNHVNALNNLVTNGANVIAEDIAFDAEPAFQQGVAAATAEAIATAGVAVHSSAGNRGDDHAARVQAVGTGAGPDGMNFAAAPPGCANNPDNVVAIAPGADTTFDVTLGQAGAGATLITLQWSEPRAIFPTAGQGGFTDLNLYVMDAALTQCLAQSVGGQANGVGDTIEQISIDMPGTAAKIVVDVQGTSSAVAAPLLDLRWRNMPAETDATTRAGSLNPDSNYTGLATAAAAVNGNTGAIEGFSSGGPVQLGLTTVCPGNAAGPCAGIAGPGITATDGRPDWAAADGVSVSGVGGFGSGTCPAVNPGDCRFFGTSASAPHAAGCDALVRDGIGAAASPVAPVNNRLASTATDIAPAGVDNTTGAGQLDCLAAVGFPTALCQNVNVPTSSGLCTANASIDAGSFDPNNDPIALTQAPPGPYGLGNTLVTLTVTETGAGALSSSCQATVTVMDKEPPVLSNVPAPIQVEQTALA
ncbi:MAG: S8 family serine peptidase, partial [Nevskiales bacterium]